MADYLRRSGVWALALLLLALTFTVPVQAAPQVQGNPYRIAQAGASATVTVNRAIVWAGPGRGFWFLGTLFRGDVVSITGVSADHLFWQASTNKGVGYLSIKDVTAVNTEGVPVVNAGIIGTITAGRVVVRGGPGFESIRVGAMSRGQQFFVLGSRPDGAWLNIQWRFGKGWVKTDLTDIDPDTMVSDDSGESNVPAASGEPRVIVNAGALNIRSGPGFIFSSLGTVRGGTEMPIIGRTLDGIWLKVDSPFGEGWVNIRYVFTKDYFGSAPIMDADETSTTYASFKALGGTVNVRKGPGIGFDVVYTVNTGTILTIKGQSHNGWWFVTSADGDGWVNKSLGQAFGDVASVPFTD